MAIVTIRYWAAAKEAAGVAEDKVDADTLADALEQALMVLRGRAEPQRRSEPASAGQPPGARADRLSRVLARSSFLVDGDPVGTRPAESVLLKADSIIEVLPPFAGG